MSTGYGYSPIGLALRDVGAGIGGTLRGIAEQRRLDLAERQQAGELGLRQALLMNQAQREAAAGQVELAKVGAQGRFQQQQLENEAARTGIARLAQGSQERFQEAQMASEQERIGIARQQQQDVAAYQRGQLAQEAARTRVAQQTATNQATALQRQSQLYDLQIKQAQQALDVSNVRVNVDARMRELGKIDPAFANFARVMGHSINPGGSLDLYEKDANGDTLVPQGVFNAQVPFLKDAYAMVQANRKHTLDPAEMHVKILDLYGKLDDVTREQIPLPEFVAQQTAYLRQPAYFEQVTHEREQLRAQMVRDLMADYATTHRGAAPPPEYLQKTIHPTVNAALETLDPTMSMYQRILAGPQAARQAPAEGGALPREAGLPPASPPPPVAPAPSDQPAPEAPIVPPLERLHGYLSGPAAAPPGMRQTGMGLQPEGIQGPPAPPSAAAQLHAERMEARQLIHQLPESPFQSRLQKAQDYEKLREQGLTHVQALEQLGYLQPRR